MKKITALIVLLSMSISICIGAYASSFTDVGDDFSWAAESIEKFCEKKIIEGRGDGTFAPDESVTRAEFAKMLALTFELNDEGQNEYSDVEEGSWEHKYILLSDAYTVSASVLYENADKVYMPNQNASRQEIAYALAAVLGLESGDDYLKKTFTDSGNVNEKLYESVNAVSAAGLIKGYTDNTLRPEGDVTRAEAVVLLDRALQYKESYEQPTEQPTAQPTQSPLPTNEPDEQPTQSPLPTSEPVSTPKSSQDIITVVDTILASANGNNYYLIYYDFRGVRSAEPLIVRPEVSVGGLKTSVADIACGDVIMYSLQVKDNINAIRVLFTPGTQPSMPETLLESVISLPQNMGWGFYNSDASTKLYYGKINKIKETDDGLRMTLEYNNNTDQMVLIPFEGAGFSLYKPYMQSPEKRFVSIDITDVKAAGNDSGAYAIVKTKRDVVTDVIIIDYDKFYK